MKSNELRIGNFYQHSISKAVIQCNRLNIAQCVGMTDNATIEPIKLTEDWLIKSDFTIKKTPSNQRFVQFNKIRIYLSNEVFKYFSVHFDAEDWCPEMGVQIYYVHQLQNLYFALTGVELLNKQP